MLASLCPAAGHPGEGVGVGAGSEQLAAPKGVWNLTLSHTSGPRSAGVQPPRVRKQGIHVQVGCVAPGFPSRCNGRNWVGPKELRVLNGESGH